MAFHIPAGIVSRFFNGAWSYLKMWFSLPKRIEKLEKQLNKSSRAENCPQCDSRMQVFHTVSHWEQGFDVWWYRCPSAGCPCNERHVKITHKAK